MTRLEKAGLVSRRDDPSHKQKVIYSLTETSIPLVPLLAHMGGWGLRHTLGSNRAAARTPPPSPTTLRREAIGSVGFTVMTASCGCWFSSSGSPRVGSKQDVPF